MDILDCRLDQRLNEMRQLWKIAINPQRPPDFVLDPEEPAKLERGKVEKARAFCFEKGWVGIGWGILDINRDLLDPSEYLKMLDVTPEDRLGFSPKSAKGPCVAFAQRMQVGDFVWCRAAGDIYWLGCVIGPWNYRYKGDFDHFDLYQVRSCKWKCVGPGDRIPGPVKNAFAGRGQAISRILKEQDAALRGTAVIWKSLTGEIIELDLKPFNQFPLSAIAHDDLEDIVALYLQMELGWLIVPSTVKLSTPVTEFVMRNRVGNRAYIQVKSGQAQIDDSQIQIPEEVDEFFVFYPSAMRADQSSAVDDRIKHITADQLSAFVKSNHAIMPTFVQLLLR